MHRLPNALWTNIITIILSRLFIAFAGRSCDYSCHVTRIHPHISLHRRSSLMRKKKSWLNGVKVLSVNCSLSWSFSIPSHLFALILRNVSLYLMCSRFKGIESAKVKDKRVLLYMYLYRTQSPAKKNTICSKSLLGWDWNTCSPSCLTNNPHGNNNNQQTVTLNQMLS